MDPGSLQLGGEVARRVLRWGNIVAGIVVLAVLEVGSVAAGSVSVAAKNYVFVPSSTTVQTSEATFCPMRSE